ncbi:MAG: hypothetical protein OXO49_06915 [Gammaproteobacteria bacterium]|nr:hypothetical protein [Gammaproteobacteria bacterium]MDE0251750.1 hypothetical protein [Gammaproteobacteria bacterium]
MLDLIVSLIESLIDFSRRKRGVIFSLFMLIIVVAVTAYLFWE